MDVGGVCVELGMLLVIGSGCIECEQMMEVCVIRGDSMSYVKIMWYVNDGSMM